MNKKRLTAALQGAAILGLLMYASMLSVLVRDIDAIRISVTCGIYAAVAVGILLGLSEANNE